MHDPDRALGTLLVAAQFALLALLAGAGAMGLAQRAPPADAIVLALGAVALGAWALAANRPGNFNIRPTPRAGGRLVQHGPYRWIRHPMYSALLLGGLACARADGALAAVALAGLAAVLWLKAGVEERAMLRTHAGYADYVARSRRFVPFVL